LSRLGSAFPAIADVCRIRAAQKGANYVFPARRFFCEIRLRGIEMSNNERTLALDLLS
jgi:hypothetical protein